MAQRALRPSLLASFQHQATKALAALDREITQHERELAALRVEAIRWQRVLHEPVRRGSPEVPPPRVPSSQRRRLDWGAVLQELPTRFTITDIAQKTGKPLAHAYTYVSRWMKDKKVRKVKEGYQKVSQAN
jgi:hypothetical protein